ncbi:MAG: type II toxin-antitoxin system VapC family toxin [Actinobacteria bacterium]|nr:type II toxin-antitoxin system VapC family toxin [Actinomycetota bacterium]
MIVDSSAVVAVLKEEAGYEELERRMLEADFLAIGAPTLVECMVVMGRTAGEDGIAAVSRIIFDLGIAVVPFDAPHADAATEAFLGFGKGRHVAGLNYGDCMTYATARQARRPLLYVGDDFAQTDIQPA